MQPVRKVAVVGAGVMGAGIAAQIANAGIHVLLLDIVRDPDNRNGVAADAVAKMLKTEPAPFMSPAAAKLVEVGNTEDDLPRLSECDWIIEAIIERLDLKQDLYRRIEIVRRPGTAVSSNTSTIPISSLVAGLPESFARDFLVTHFFNPPRYMRLLELVAGAATDPTIVTRISRFADITLGKTIVSCKDSPGFIANRLGVYWLQLGLLEAIDAGLTVEAADAVMSKPFGIPKTGVFGLIDLVGLDLMPHVNASLAGLLPATDAFHKAQRDLPLLAGMIASGHTGRKGKGGFYRFGRAGGRKSKEAIDLATGEFRPEEPAKLVELADGGRDLRALLGGSGPASSYAWRVISRTLAYAASLVPEATDEIAAIDEAMRLGYNWTYGPFELADRIGVDWLVEKLAAEGEEVPVLLKLAAGRSFYRIENGQREALGLDGAYHTHGHPEGVLLLEDIKRTATPLLSNPSAALWDIGDGVTCLEFTSKGNTLDTDILTLIQSSIALVRERYAALVIYSDSANFSFGANLAKAMDSVRAGAWGDIETLIDLGQGACQALKYAPFPVVGAPSGMALGGGCEILLHCDAVQAHAESYVGLVECGVGLLPGWGGCAAMLSRWQALGKLPRGPVPAAMQVFELVSTATVSKSAADAKAKLFLRPTDGITMNRDRLLADAKARALALVPVYAPPEPAAVTLPGAAGYVLMDMAVEAMSARGLATAHDKTVSRALAAVLSGGDADPTILVTDTRLLELEREHFLNLVQTEPTQARIEHTLATGKPLRN
jgi:3-hydroxyacyl-CoA dehydrogenase